MKRIGLLIILLFTFAGTYGQTLYPYPATGVPYGLNTTRGGYKFNNGLFPPIVGVNTWFGIPYGIAIDSATHKFKYHNGTGWVILENVSADSLVTLGMLHDSVVAEVNRVAVPKTRTITINGITQNLEQNVSYTVSGGGGGSTDTTSLSNRIDQRVAYTDTAGMLVGYVRDSDTLTNIGTKTNLKDSMNVARNLISAKQNQLSGTGFVKQNGGTTTYDNSTYLTTEIDGSITNELQTLSRAGSTVTLSNGGGSFVDSVKTYSQGSNVTITGTYPNYTISAVQPSLVNYVQFSDTASRISTKQNLVDSSASLRTSINTKQAQLNGTGFVKQSGTTTTYDNSTYLTSEVDGSVTNEIQTLGRSGSNITLTSGGSVVDSFARYTQGTNVTITGTYPNYTISSAGGGGVSVDTTSLSNRIDERVKYSDTATMLAPYVTMSEFEEVALLTDLADSTEYMRNQVATKQNQLNGTGFVKQTGTTTTYDNSTYLTSEVDGSTTNEIQTLGRTGNTITLTGGGGSVVDSSKTYNQGTNVTITGTYPNYTINATQPSLNGYMQFSDTNTYIATKSNLADSSSNLRTAINTKQNQLSGTGFVKQSGGTTSYDNSTYLTTEVDGSTTNEIQTLGRSGNTITLTGGGSVVDSFPRYSQGTNITITGTYPNYTINSTGGSGVTDGDKGDVTVSASGATWTVDALAINTGKIAGQAVTYAKMQNQTAPGLLGKGTAGAGATTLVTIGSGLTLGTDNVLSASGGGGGVTSGQLVPLNYALAAGGVCTEATMESNATRGQYVILGNVIQIFAVIYVSTSGAGYGVFTIDLPESLRASHAVAQHGSVVGGPSSEAGSNFSDISEVGGHITRGTNSVINVGFEADAAVTLQPITIQVSYLKF